MIASIAHQLVEAGITTAFAYPGHSVDDLLGVLADTDALRLIVGVSELSSSAAAHGHWMATGHPAALLISDGAGVDMAAPMIAMAAREGAGLLVLVPGLLPGPHRSAAVLEAAGAVVVGLDGLDLRAAVNLATSGKVVAALMGNKRHLHPAPALDVRSESHQAIVLGPSATAAQIRRAQSHSCPVITMAGARVPDVLRPRWLGSMVLGSNPGVFDLVGLGALDAGTLDPGSLDAGSLDAGSLDAGSLDAGTLDAGALDPGRRHAASLDTGTLDPGRRHAASLGSGTRHADYLASTNVDSVTMACGTTLAGIATPTGMQDWLHSLGSRTRIVAEPESGECQPRRLRSPAAKGGGHLLLDSLMALAANLQNAVLVSDAGVSHKLTGYVAATTGNPVVGTLGPTTMGWGPGAALGAAMATGQPVILSIGDGSLAMTGWQLLEWQRNGVAGVIVGADNGTLGSVKARLGDSYPGITSSAISPGMVWDGLGIPWSSITAGADPKPALDWASGIAASGQVAALSVDTRGLEESDYLFPSGLAWWDAIIGGVRPDGS